MRVRYLALALLAASVACGPVPSAEVPAAAPSAKDAKHGAKHGGEAKPTKVHAGGPTKEASVESPAAAPPAKDAKHASKATKSAAKSHNNQSSKAIAESSPQAGEGAGAAPAASSPSSPSPEPAAAAADSSSAMGGAGMPLLCVSLIAIAACYNYQSDISAFVGGLSGWGLQLGAFFVLVGVQSGALLLFKVAQTSGSYSFSPASSVALTELCKLFLAVSLHARYVATTPGASPLGTLTPRCVLHYFGLAMCYTVNNQLTFYCFELIDPGTFALGKSVAPYLVALMLRITGDRLNQLQWVCILLQCILIAVTQYNACKSAPALGLHAYLLMLLTVSITAISSVWNQKVVKGFDVPVNLQNAVLYSFGLVIAILSYLVVPDKRGEGKGFFSGYTVLAVFLVFFQAFHGLAVTLVYKYADAIVKNFANSCVMGVLVIVSAYFFGVVTTVHSWLGVAGVLVTTYAYMNIALKMGPPS